MKLTLQNSAYPLAAVLAIAFCSLGISGGPVYKTGVSVTGSYGGTLTPACLACDNGGQQVAVKCGDNFSKFLKKNPGFNDCSSSQSCASNSQGVFSLTVPSTGISSGTFVMFSQGRVFTGTIRASADAGKSNIAAVLSATFDFTVTDPITGDTTDVTASANGQLNAKITVGNSSTPTRLNGLATLDISQGEVNVDLSPRVTCAMDLTVTGFKQ